MTALIVLAAAIITGCFTLPGPDRDRAVSAPPQPAQTPCPTPRKIRHATSKAARAQLRDLQARYPTSPDLTVYRCVCGRWHVGHSQAALNRRIRRALRLGRA